MNTSWNIDNLYILYVCEYPNDAAIVGTKCWNKKKLLEAMELLYETMTLNIVTVSWIVQCNG